MNYYTQKTKIEFLKDIEQVIKLAIASPHRIF